MIISSSVLKGIRNIIIFLLCLLLFYVHCSGVGNFFMKKKFVKVVSGTSAACVLASDGGVYCWGDNRAGEVGNPSNKGDFVEHPSKVMLSASIMDISYSWEHVCALSTKGSVYCWGNNNSHEVSPSGEANIYRPFKVALPAPAVSIQTGPYVSCSTLKNKKIYCWGSNSDGILDPADGKSEIAYPRQVLADTPILDFKLALGYLCYINMEGKVFCRGEVTNNADNRKYSDLIEVSLPSPASNFFSTSYVFCVALKDKASQCWDSFKLDPNDTNKQRKQGSDGFYADSFPYGSDTDAVNGTGFCTMNNSKIICNDYKSTSISKYSSKINGIKYATIQQYSNESYACAVTKIGDLYCWQNTGSLLILPKGYKSGKIYHLGGPRRNKNPL